MSDESNFKQFDGKVADEDMGYAEKYENLTDKQRAIVDYVASNPDYDTFEEIAEYANCTSSYAAGQVNEKEELIKFRSTMDSNSPGSEAVKAAMEAESGETGTILPDGQGTQKVDVKLSLDEVFRCIRLLPQDLSSVFFTQIRNGSGRAGVRELFDNDEE